MVVRQHRTPQVARAVLGLGVPVMVGCGLLLAWALPGRGSEQIRLTGSGSLGAAPATSAWGAGSPVAVPGRFSISGTVAGLYPGVSLPLVLSVTNPRHHWIVLHNVTAAAADASTGCLASNLSVSSFSGQLPIPALGSAHVTLQASLAHGAGNPCQGAVFPLAYTGSATVP